jgi:ABC-2 type transport system ATP-binding protein
MFGLLGPNGSGKTTLFRLLTTLLDVQRGELSVCGFDLRTSRQQVRQRIGVTFQSPALDVRLTVRENLCCHAALYGLPGNLRNERITLLSRKFQIADRLNSIVGTLSGGLKRRVELVKGLLHQPRVLLLDEPSTGLDVRARREFFELIREQRHSSGTTIIIATHLMDEAEQCDELLLLDRGRVVASGSPSALQASLKGERLTLRCRDAELAMQTIPAFLNSAAIRLGDELSFRLDRAADRIPDLLHQFGTQILSLQISMPGLEDVFLSLTGRTLEASETDE